VIIGLVVLASEFEKAQRVLRFVRSKVELWTDWIGRQNWFVRILVGLATALFVGAVMYAVVLIGGLPDWFPGRLVPPLPGLEKYTDWN